MVAADWPGPLDGFAPEAAGVDAQLYLRPVGVLSGLTAERATARALALPLAGGPLAFSEVEVIVRLPAGVRRGSAHIGHVRGWAQSLGSHVAQTVEDWLARMSAERAPLAGLPLEDGPQLMGVVNATPDSFSDGGDRYAHADAIAGGRALAEAGAAILDVGGESTRPGSTPVDVDEEIGRVEAVVRQLAAEGQRVSIDSRNARTMRHALEAGAAILNDVTALTHDPDSLEVARTTDAPVILMHMQGTPQTMQVDPQYEEPALDIFDRLSERLAVCVAAGIPRHRICLDPGIGFGKTTAHNLALLRQVGLFHGLGCPLLVGVSRKRFIARLSRDEPAKERLPGSLAAAQVALDQGVQLIRSHDVAETAQALAVWRAIHGP